MTNQYKSLNDAAENPDVREGVRKLLAPGRTEIWYMNRKGLDTWGFISKGMAESPMPMPREVKGAGTHVLLGTVAGKDAEDLWSALQGEFWSPRGEAADLVRGKGLTHTSMSVGDIIVIGNKGWMVGSFGFEELPRTKKEQDAILKKAQDDMAQLRQRYSREDTSMRSVLRSLEEADDANKAVGFGWHKPKNIEDGLRAAYLDAQSLKADFDRLDEIPAWLNNGYSSVIHLTGAINGAMEALKKAENELRNARRHAAYRPLR